MSTPDSPPSWALLTPHARLLHLLDEDPRLRMDQLADALGITPRTAYRIVGELEASGLLRRFRVGRRNRYEVQAPSWLAAAVRSDDEVHSGDTQRRRPLSA